MLHLLERPVLGLLRIKGEKNPASGGNQTHDLSVTRSALYCCATTATQPAKQFRLYSRPFSENQGQRISSSFYDPLNELSLSELFNLDFDGFSQSLGGQMIKPS